MAKSELSIKTLETMFSQFGVRELENIRQLISDLINKRKKEHSKAKESDLILKLTTECVLPENYFEEYNNLVQKRNVGKISKKEQDQLTKLISQEEKLRIERVKIIGALAELKGVSFEKVIEEFELETV